MSGRGKKGKAAGERERRPGVDAATETEDGGVVSADYAAAKEFVRGQCALAEQVKTFPEAAVREGIASEESAQFKFLRSAYNSLRSVVYVLHGYLADVAHEEAASREFIRDLEAIKRRQLAVQAAYAHSALLQDAARRPRAVALHALHAARDELAEAAQAHALL